jgi:hypothetical protein
MLIRERHKSVKIVKVSISCFLISRMEFTKPYQKSLKQVIVTFQNLYFSNILMLEQLIIQQNENVLSCFAITNHCLLRHNQLGGCPRIEGVARESGFESIFLIIMRRILAALNKFNQKNGPKSAFPQ